MSFASPLGLLLGLLAGPLLALYFVRLRRRPVPVSSTLLWLRVRDQERQARPFERFRNQLLLWLQLLALALLALALGQPVLEQEVGSSSHVVVVLDLSASMGAKDGRFAEALGVARDLADGAGPEREVALVAALSVPAVLSGFSQDAGALRAVLADLDATEAEVDLAAALRLAYGLAQAEPGAEVVVLTDGAGPSRTDWPLAPGAVRVLRVGRASTNTAVVDLDLRGAGGQRQVFAEIVTTGKDPTDAVVLVSLDEEVLHTETVTLQPGESRGVATDLPAGASGVLKVEVQAAGDGLLADDHAFAIVSREAPTRLGLVEIDPFTQRAIDALEGIEVVDVPVEGIASAEVDALLTTRPVPRELPVPVAALHPDAATVTTLGPAQDHPRVSGWQRTHPLARFVAWDDLRLADARAVRATGGLSEIVSATTGPLVLAGEVEGRRRVELAFEPLRSDVLLRAAWPVFVLNTVTWLTEGEQATRTHARTGTVLLRPGAEALGRVTGPAEAHLDVQGGLVRLRGADKVGVYEVRAGARRERLAFNLASRAESDIAPGNPVLPGAQGEALSTAGVGRTELWRPLLMMALVLLALEWGVWARRTTPRAAG